MLTEKAGIKMIWVGGGGLMRFMIKHTVKGKTSAAGLRYIKHTQGSKKNEGI